jgi:hypothetical protein
LVYLYTQLMRLLVEIHLLVILVQQLQVLRI